ncbi:MAG: hypothetical protein PHY31_10980, partial [Smithellaceae bacterium]|nr:hypothetical protein [Smithellaceae bacterium]
QGYVQYRTGYQTMASPIPSTEQRQLQPQDDRVRDVMANALLYQAWVGVKPLKNVDIKASFAIAKVDKKPAPYVTANNAWFFTPAGTDVTYHPYVGDEYGKELDITAKVQLTSNLEYMIGAGYLWTGDYFKGTSSSNEVGNDYLIIHKLTFSF